MNRREDQVDLAVLMLMPDLLESGDLTFKEPWVLSDTGSTTKANERVGLDGFKAGAIFEDGVLGGGQVGGVIKDGMVRALLGQGMKVKGKKRNERALFAGLFDGFGM